MKFVLPPTFDMRASSDPEEEFSSSKEFPDTLFGHKTVKYGYYFWSYVENQGKTHIKYPFDNQSLNQYYYRLSWLENRK